MSDFILNMLKDQLRVNSVLVLKIKSRPNAPQTKFISKMSDNTIKIDISAERDKGKANQELIKFLARVLDLDKKNIKIISGQTAQNKLIKCQKNK